MGILIGVMGAFVLGWVVCERTMDYVIKAWHKKYQQLEEENLRLIGKALIAETAVRLTRESVVRQDEYLLKDERKISSQKGQITKLLKEITGIYCYLSQEDDINIKEDREAYQEEFENWSKRLDRHMKK